MGVALFGGGTSLAYFRGIPWVPRVPWVPWVLLGLAEPEMLLVTPWAGTCLHLSRFRGPVFAPDWLLPSLLLKFHFNLLCFVLFLMFSPFVFILKHFFTGEPLKSA